MSLGMVVSVALVAALAYVTYLLVSTVRSIQKQRAAILQWPGLPVHWLYGNLHQTKLERYVLDGASFPVTQHVSLLTLDILLRCAFSYDSSCQIQGDEHPYVKAVAELSKTVTERTFSMFLYFNLPFGLSSVGRKFKKNCDFVHKVADEIIKRRRKQLDTNKQGHDAGSDRKYLDFLDVLLSARDESGKGLTDMEIRNEVDTFLFEGHDTTASSLTWMLYAIATHPEHQRKVQEEIDEVMSGRESEDVGWDDLGKFKYLVQCLKESMRMYPPVPFIMRVLERDVEIDGKILPAGSSLLMAIYCLHHNPQVWPDHMIFDPNRFSPDNIQKMDPFSYLPFAAGPRNCIGQNFALNEQKVILVRLLRRYTVQLDPSHPVQFSGGMILKAHNDIKIFLKPRVL